ncbi:unnamed protein product, partial [Rotaria magnacalcarata]
MHSRLSELKFLEKDLATIKQILNRRLMELYSDDVIEEWFELYLTPTGNEINTIFVEFALVDNITTWERRPL